MKIKNRIIKFIGIIFGRRIFFNLGIILQHIAHRMMGIGNYENSILSGELFVLKLIKKSSNLKKKFVFIDIGAGRSSEQAIFLNKFFPKLTAYLFEPMPYSYKKLKQNISSKNINVYNLAVSDKSGTLILYDYKNRQTEHATAYKDTFLLAENLLQKVECKKISLEAFTKNNKIKKIDFLKIDTEGHEYQILHGFKANLNTIRFIQFEFNHMNINSQVRFKDFYDLLSDTFNIYRIYQDGLIQIRNYEPIYQEIYEFQNYLAIRKK